MDIFIDWGSTNFRAFLMNGSEILERRNADGHGVLRIFSEIPSGDRSDYYSRFLKSQIDDWLALYPEAGTIMCGAIGSREGWIDTGYVEAPSDLEKLARGLRVLEENEKRDLPNREISILPGLAVMHENGRHDVMRSEDVKSLGAAIHSGIKDSVLCIPGTHCKWVRIRGGAIIDFHSVLTGEFYAVLGEMGALASVLRADENNQTMDYDSFDRGLDLTRAGHDLLADLWQVRCQKLRAAAPPAHLRSYFSGILIGHELRQMEIVFPGLKEITLVSDSGTRKNLYGHALKKMGLSVLAEVESEAAICAGLSALKACL